MKKSVKNGMGTSSEMGRSMFGEESWSWRYWEESSKVD